MITKNSRFCFIHPPQIDSLDDRLDIPLGLLYVVSAMKKEGYKNVKIIDFSGMDGSLWEGMLPYADVYGFQTYTTSYDVTLQLKEMARAKNPKALMIAGGAHASAVAHETIKDFNMVVIGDGEILPTLDLNDRFHNIFYCEVKDLNKLSFPDLNDCNMDYSRIVDGKRALSFITSRGCFNNCAFCCTRGVRFRSIDNCCQELRQLKEKYSDRSFIFYDDNFVIHEKRCIELCNRIKELDIRFRCNSHCDKSSPDLYRSLYNAGCRNICFGVESGNEQLRKKMNKKFTNDDIKKAFNAAKNAGIITKVFLMVGFPGETQKTIEDTIKLMNEIKPDQYTVFNFVPLPGSDTWINPKRYGITSLSKDYKQYYNIAGDNEGGISFVSDTVTPDKMIGYRKMLLAGLKELEWKGDKQDYQRVI